MEAIAAVRARWVGDVEAGMGMVGVDVDLGFARRMWCELSAFFFLLLMVLFVGAFMRGLGGRVIEHCPFR